MNPYLQLALQLEPLLPGLITDFKALFTRHPALADPAAQAALIAAIADAASSIDDATLAAIAADQAKHSTPAPVPGA